ncbi:hypothetical protein SORBI_3004G133900 [Sorghum bicolor]|uniref:Uncharacterized protein n=1 Tax=Sorghum bicolor TaxID=4558 RepID=A0A194YPE3_SORBI|nr:hypothetical protein SORBI_3004G133900 [Sorghum bicolor]
MALTTAAGRTSCCGVPLPAAATWSWLHSGQGVARREATRVAAATVTCVPLDRSNKILYIIDLHAPNLWRTSDNPSKPYTATLNIILNHFNLAMKLANLTWNDNIFVWRCEFKNNHPRSFLVYNFIKSWNGERLTLSHSLRTEFIVDILKSSTKNI